MKKSIFIAITVCALAISSNAQSFILDHSYSESGSEGSYTQPQNAYVYGSTRFYIETSTYVKTMDGPQSAARAQVTAIGLESSPWIESYAGEHESQSDMNDYWSDTYQNISQISYYIWISSSYNAMAYARISLY